MLAGDVRRGAVNDPGGASLKVAAGSEATVGLGQLINVNQCHPLTAYAGDGNVVGRKHWQRIVVSVSVGNDLYSVGLGITFISCIKHKLIQT